MSVKSFSKKIKPNRHFNLFWQYRNQPADTRADYCPYCESREVVKRGRRQKKFETLQLYRCKTCTKTFTAQIVKYKHYPLRMILDGVSLYNLGYTRSEACQLIKEKYGPEIKPSTLANWIRELAPLCRYARLRDKATKLYSPHKVIKSLTLTTSRSTTTSITRPKWTCTSIRLARIIPLKIGRFQGQNQPKRRKANKHPARQET